MKKLLVFLGLIFVGTCAFANIELDVTLYGTPYQSRKAEFDYDTIPESWKSQDWKSGFAFGSEDAVTFFFGDSPKQFEVGLGLLVDFDVFSKIEVKGESINCTGINLGFGIGPVFRYTFSDSFSLFARPSFVLGVTSFRATENNSAEITFTDATAVLDLNVGGRSWFVNADGFHFGLSYGAIVAAGAGSGSRTGKNSDTLDYKVNDVKFKLYVGVCFNFGDRGIDR